MTLLVSLVSLIIFLIVSASTQGDVSIAAVKGFMFGVLYDKDDTDAEVTFYTFQASILFILLTVTWERYE